MNNTANVIWRLIFLVTVLYWVWHLLGFEMTVVFIGVQLILILGGIADRMDYARKKSED